MACNCSALLRPEEKGSKTEVALLKFLDKTGIKYENIRENMGEPF